MWNRVGPQPLPPPRRGSTHAAEADRATHHNRAALCQVYDSIYLDVPMSRVKFNVNSEYAYIQNFKVLQSMFAKPRPAC
jgi:hypothetical protein